MPRTLCRAPLLALALVSLAAGAARAAVVWWEGEAPAETNFPARTWFSASTFPEKRDVLSGGDWLTHDGERKGPEAFARYRVAVPEAGTYTLWCRKFWKHGPFRWRFDGGDWRVCGRDVGLVDSVPIREHLCVNWVTLGEVKLARGVHVFELRLLAGPGEKRTACFDCFALASGPFVPRGKLKPGQTSGLSEPGWWALEPPPDPFAASPIDLRGRNEAEAGAGGFVRAEGDRVVRADGTPLRFWAVNVGPDVVRLGEGAQRYLARRLAKVGVNAVRIHGAVFDQGAADPAAVNERYLADLQRLVAVLKAEGIYAHLSFYFPLWFRVRPEHGLAGYEGMDNKKPFALLFFDPAFQAAHRAWAKALLATPNPHTGVPLAQDPAVAMVEIVNEDSLFFWTFTAKNVPPPQMAKLEARFGAWAAARYGSPAKALAAWQGAGHPRDAPGDGRLGLFDAWHMTADGHGQGGKRRRVGDQVRFLGELQRAFYAATAAYLKRDLGYGGLVVCGNWKTADARVLGPVERWTYTAGDVIDRHGYFGGKHEGPRSSYSVSVGDTFESRAGVREPGALPTHCIQPADHPQIISEIGWPNPNRFKAEFPLLAAACAAAQGLDGLFFFAVGGPSWETSARKFACATPTILGQFPALALALRRGDLEEGPVVVGQALAVEDFWALKGGAAVAPAALDALRQADAGGAVPAAGSIDPFAFALGRVVERYDQGRSRLLVRPLATLIDRKAKRLATPTGAVRWDYGTGVCLIDTPRTQAVGGFLGQAGPQQLGNVTIACANEFACVTVTSLDDAPLATATRVLVQAVTEEKPYGWRVEGGTIADLGGPPMLVRNLDATVTLKGGGPWTARALDAHGYPRDVRVAVTREGGATSVTLPADGLYTVLERP